MASLGSNTYEYYKITNNEQVYHTGHWLVSSKKKEDAGHYEIEMVTISCLQVQIQGSTRFRSKKA